MRCLESTGAERAEWLTAWEATGRQPFAHPDYVNLFTESDGDAIALLSEGEGATVLLPLIRRRLPPHPWVGSVDPERLWVDAVSPYGYGGPFASGRVEWREYYVELLAWMHAARVLTCFVRLSLDAPVPQPPLPVGLRAQEISKNIVVDLRRSMDEQWRHYAHKVRKNVNKARRAGLRVEITPGFSNLDGFLAVYHETMKRRQADAGYFFDSAFFEALDRGGVGLLQADVFDPADHLLSTELVLMSRTTLYSFLGGTRQEAFPHAPNDLLKHEVIAYGHAHGMATFVLGGGYEPDDGIFRYKRGFDEEGIVTYFGLQLITDVAAYDDLSRASGSVKAEPIRDGNSTFFPRYRTPGARTDGTT